MEYTTRDQWHRRYADGRGFRPLAEPKRRFRADHLPTQPGPRALADREVKAVSGAWGEVEEYETDRMTVLVLRHPRPARARETSRVQPQEGTA
ncbi:hypothetical protein A6A06_01245 [Streptomyces sp. CB02923]|uniref:hypothetical protein n=1 Tax=Streptomyces sp. CB02923 TaxID=1718985 RepID=UPI000938F306|nr:hypothetical protein [Streptomyces sp. CB02923]OKI09367.1 hypothetical protein A6A06_01245 [Streptomyces sp. CB02923]